MQSGTNSRWFERGARALRRKIAQLHAIIGRKYARNFSEMISHPMRETLTTVVLNMISSPFFMFDHRISLMFWHRHKLTNQSNVRLCWIFGTCIYLSLAVFRTRSEHNGPEHVLRTFRTTEFGVLGSSGTT